MRSDEPNSFALLALLPAGQQPLFPLNASFIDVRDIAQAFRLAVERFLLSARGQMEAELVEFVQSGDAAVLQGRRQASTPAR